MAGARVAIHIGYHQTASTWFQQVVVPRHPMIRSWLTGAPANDPFLAEIIGCSDLGFDPSRARSRFEDRAAQLQVPHGGLLMISAERLSGDAASGGYDEVRIAERLASVLPDAKVFAVVREQVDMIESEYHRLVLEGLTASLPTLLESRPNWKTVVFDPGHYEYDRLAGEYVRLFGAERFRLFEFCAMCAKPALFLTELADFLEIEPWPQLDDSDLTLRMNADAPRRLLGARRVLNNFQRSALNPYPVADVRPVWRSPLSALASRLPPPKAPLLDDEARARLRERFHHSNRRLAAEFGIEFAQPTAASPRS
ncbi:MAG TPA: hypothetical protein VIC35_08020 [Acidimicrobiia bacterium]|jgi:hypothetical protein